MDKNKLSVIREEPSVLDIRMEQHLEFMGAVVREREKSFGQILKSDAVADCPRLKCLENSPWKKMALSVGYEIWEGVSESTSQSKLKYHTIKYPFYTHLWYTVVEVEIRRVQESGCYIWSQSQ